MKYYPTLLLNLLFVTFCYSQTITDGSLMHDGLERTYQLYFPASYQEGGDPLPLVFNCHGFGSNALEQRFYSGMDAVAEEEGFIVCYPDGFESAWNVGWAFGSQADDVGFVGAMIDQFVENYNIDERRVYSCGMSNGGFFSYTLACEIPDRIAAIASVTGGMREDVAENCQPNIPTPIMQIHGTADLVVNYEGTANVSLPIEDVVNRWIEINGCDNTAVIETPYPDINENDNSTATRFDYATCDDDSEVVLIKIDGGAHTWPGAAINIGVTNQDFNASAEIWEFFNRFSRSIATNVNTLESNTTTIQVIPNPNSGSFIISSNEIISEIKVFDIYGRLVYHEFPNSTELAINTLPQGNYTASMIINDDVSTEKIIIR